MPCQGKVLFFVCAKVYSTYDDSASGVYMADLAEILILEHLAIKNANWIVDKPYNPEAFTRFRIYLKACHIEVEEKICFPILESYSFPDAKQFRERAERIKADHKLIDTLALNIIRWGESENAPLISERMPLFFRLLVEHNTSEETDLFPRWDSIDSLEMKSSVRDAMSIIESFGVKEYTTAVGINESAFSYIFRSGQQ